MIGVGRFGIWRPPQDFGIRYMGDPRRFSAYGLAALWDTARQDTKAFNVNDISGLASIVAGGINVAQATGANQPLGVGTPQYGEFPSIQFTAANVDRLQVAANLIGAAPATMIAVWRWRNTTGDYFALSNCSVGGGAGWSLGSRSGATGRDSVAAGVSARTDGVVGTAAPEVWICRDWAAASPVADMWINGVKQAISAAAVIRTTPGAGGQVVLGSLEGAILAADVDFCLGAIFTAALDDSVSVRISHALGARAGSVA